MSATNGQTTSHSNPTTDDLDSQLQTARKRLELAQVTRRLELMERHKTKRQHLKENAEGWDTFLSGYSDLIDRFRGPDRDLIFPVSTAYDRRYGCNWPFWRTWQDHARIRASSRVVTGTSGLAYGVLSGLTSYIVGDGMLAGATAAHDSVDPALVAAVQQLCDTFYESQEFAAVQQELVFRDRRDGEFFLRMFAKDDGNTVIRTVEPEQIVEPPNKSMDEASFGIFVDPEDLQDVRGYWVAYDGDSGNGEYVPGEEMIHSKANVDRIIKRGAPDYMFDTLDLIKTASRLIENIGQGAAIQAAIAFVRQHAAADATAIADYVEGMASYDVREPFNGSTQPLQRFDPGTIIDIDSGQEFVATPFGANVQGFQAAVQVLLRALAVKWNAPEWITSADSSNNNFSSSLVAESPFVRSVKRFQRHYATCFLRVVRYAVRHWIRRRGKITVKGKSYDWNAIEKLVKIAVTPPTAEVRDRNQEAQRDKNYLDMGVKSRQLIAEEQGIDYERVERDNEEYEKAHPQQGGPGGGGEGGNQLAAMGDGDSGGQQAVNPPDGTIDAERRSSPDEQPAGAGLAELLTESEEIVCLRETIRLLEAGQKRGEGEVWQGAGNRWFTVKGGRTVPAKNPKQEGGGGKQPGKPKPETKPGGKAQPKAPVTPKTAKPKAATVDELHDAIQTAKQSGKPASADDVRALAERVKAMKADDIKALRAKSGLTKTTGNGTKEVLADDLARKMLAPEPAKEKTPAPKKPPTKKPVAEKPAPAPKQPKTPANMHDHVMQAIDALPENEPYVDMANLRKSVSPDRRAALDDAIWDLVKQRKAFVVKDGYAGHLTAEQKAELLTDGEGDYFNAIYRGDAVEAAPKAAPSPKAEPNSAPRPKTPKPDMKQPKGEPSPAAPESKAPTVNVKTAAEAESHVMRALDSLSDPDKDPFVDMAELRKAVPPGQRDAFDDAMWKMVKDRKIFVQRHNQAGLLSRDERDSLLSDGEGGYYHSISRGDSPDVAPKAEQPKPQPAPKQPSTDELIGKLKQYEPGSYEVPFAEIDQMPGYTLDLEKDELKKRFANAPEAEVSLDDLIATQEMVYGDNLRYTMSGGAAGALPQVVKQGGKYYLDDGTHRAVAAKLQGARKLKVKLLDLDATAKPSTPDESR